MNNILTDLQALRNEHELNGHFSQAQALTKVIGLVRGDLVKYNEKHDESSGQFASGDGGGSAGKRSSAAAKPAAKPTDKSSSDADKKKAHEEFKFLNRRLAAGNLKRGERKLILRRQEILARQVYGIADGA